jgi:hypothetical protein
MDHGWLEKMTPEQRAEFAKGFAYAMKAWGWIKPVIGEAAYGNVFTRALEHARRAAEESGQVTFEEWT